MISLTINFPHILHIFLAFILVTWNIKFIDEIKQTLENIMKKRKNILFVRENTWRQTRRMLKKLNQDGKKILIASDKETCFNQDVF